MGKTLHFIRKNYFLAIIVLASCFVVFVTFYKLFITKPSYVYVKVKVGQGTWWASTQRPSLWYVKAIQQAKEQKDLTGKPVAEILDVIYYPYYGSSQFDVYVTAKLKATKIGNTGTFNFNREAIGVGSPIDLEFSNVQFSGTIIDVSRQRIKESYVEKTIYLTKKYAYPWEYDAIQIGDSVSDGKQTVFQITDKAKGETSEVLLNDLGKLNSTQFESYQYIILQAKVLVKKVDNQFMYGEETVVSPGRNLGITTNRITLNDYIVAKVE